MNKGFAFYYRNAFKSSAATIYKNKSLLQVLMYFLAGFVAKVTFLFSAAFLLADVRQAKLADENRRFDIPQSFKVATKPKPVWTMVLSIIAEAFIFLGGTLLIAVLTAILALIGFVVWYFVQGPTYIILLFCIPGGLVFLVYALMMFLIFSPTAYIIETNPNLGVYETVKICFDSMKSTGKGTVFLNVFITGLLELVVVGICAAGVWFLPQLLARTGVVGYAPVIMAAWYIFSIVLVLLLVPMFDLVGKIALKNLFEDIVLDPINAGKRTAGINIKMCQGVKFKPTAGKDNLVALFDETPSDSVPAPDSPARRKIKEQAEKAAALREQEAAKEVRQEVHIEQAPAKETKPAEQPETPVEKPVEPTEQPAEVNPVEPTEQPAEKPAEPVEKPVEEKPVEPTEQVEEQPAPVEPVSEQPAAPTEEAQVSEAPVAEEKPKRKRTVKAKPAQSESAPSEEPAPQTEETQASEEQPAEEKPKKTRTTRKKTSE